MSTGVRRSSDNGAGSGGSPDELEQRLNRHPQVREALVIRRPDVQGGQHMIAYVVPVDAQPVQRLRDRLEFDCGAPPHFHIVFVTALPLTADGQYDTARLAQLPVIDDKLIACCEQALLADESVDRVAVLPAAPVRRMGAVHRLDICPARARGRRSEPGPTESRGDALEAPGWDKDEPGRPSAIAHGPRLGADADRPATLGAALRRAANRYPEHGITYVRPDGSRSFHTYPQLLDEAGHWWSRLARLGVRQGDKVILQLCDNREFITVFWACVLGGATPVPVSVAPDYSPENAVAQKLVNAWRLFDRPLILASPGLAPGVRTVFEQTAPERAEVRTIADLEGAGPVPDDVAGPDDVTLMLLTSGSTGTPKAVMHSHRTLLSRSAGTAAFNHFSGEDVSVNWMPLDHVGGIVMFHLRDVFTGCTQVHADTQWILEQPLRWLDLIDTYRATVTWAPNFAYALVVEHADEIAQRHWDLSSMRFILNGGEAVVARTAYRFLRLLESHGLSGDCMFPAWGMSETASGITYSHDFSVSAAIDADAPVAVGGPIPGTSLRIVDSDNRLCTEGETGNLQVRGASLMLGYYQNPDANSAVFTSDGWFDTGDIGYLSGGRLTVTARAKDEIIINGVNYAASEIEAVVDSVDGVEVSFSAACAVRRPEADTDELAVFFTPVSFDDEGLADMLPAIRARVASDAGIMPSYLVPVQRDQIPKTAIGKIQRAQLKRRFETGEFDPVLKHADLLAGANVIPDWFYRKVWLRKEPAFGRDLDQQATILIFLDACGLGELVCARLKQFAVSCVTVEPGEGFARLGSDRYRIDPASDDDYRALLKAAGENGMRIGTILHCWTYQDPGEGASTLEELGGAQQRGVYSILRLVQALAGESVGAGEVSLFLIGSGTQVVSDADDGACTHSATVGLMKTIPLELDWLRCRHIDLEAGADEKNAGFVLDELRSMVDEDEVAYREDRRLVWALEPVAFSEPADGRSPVKHGGIYLVTGGLGGIGAYLAQALVRDHDARLVLVGTTPLPARSEWSAILARGGRLAERIRRYLDIESLGGQFVYESADVAEPARLEEIVTAAEARWGDRLSGVFHLAVGGDMASHWQNMERHSVLNETPDSFERMFRAKVYGTWALYQVARARPGAFIAPFGSVIGVFGAAQFASYAAAHTFMRNYTLRERYRGTVPGFNFSWAVWEETGLSQSDPEFARDFYRATGYCTIPREQGYDSLMAGLCHDLPDLIVGLDGTRPNVASHVRSRPLPLQEVAAFCVPARPDGPDASQAGRPVVRDRFGSPAGCGVHWLQEMPLQDDGGIDVERLQALREGEDGGQESVPRTELEQRVAELWNELLSVRHFGIHDSFFRLGGNSLGATRLISRIRESFGVSVDIRDLFAHGTVCELAALVEARQSESRAEGSDEQRPALDAGALLENVDQMSDSEVAELLEQLRREETAK